MPLLTYRPFRNDFLAQATVFWESPSKRLEEPVMIQNKSQTGLAFQLGKPIPLGAVVRVQQSNHVYRGWVKHCSEVHELNTSGRQFLIGIKFLPNHSEGRS